VLTLHPLRATTGPRQGRLPVAYLLIYLSPYPDSLSSQPAASLWLVRPHPNKGLVWPSATSQTSACGACLGRPKPVQGLRNCLRHRYAKPQKPVLAWVISVVLSKGGQDRTGHPPPPPAIHACGGRPQGGEGRRAPTYKPQGFSEQKPRLAAGWRRLAWVGLGRFVLTVLKC